MSTKETQKRKKQLHTPASRKSPSAAQRRRQLLQKRRRLLRRKRQVRLQVALVIFCVLIVAGLFVLLLSRLGTTAVHRGNFSINAACEAYRADVEAEAANYGMSDYVDLILALMMQESSGRGPDVMQSSEGAYNKKYPQVPNGITDVDYSIACGIQELKYSMEKAGVSSPDDMNRIRLALQGYNFGADVYFSYLEKHGITAWSEETAEAFAQNASGGKARAQDDPLYETAGPWAYGDQKYPEHVLRYYHPA